MATVDNRLAAGALAKLDAGERPTREEAAALRRVKKGRDDEQRLAHYRAIPKKLWREWSGRQHKVLGEQAIRYGAPIGSATISLPDFVRWFHDFLSTHARRLNAPDDEDPAIAGATSPAMERKRLIDAKRAELKYQQELGRWIPRTLVHEGMQILAPLICDAGRRLLERFGPEAHAILEEALDDAQTAFSDHFDDPRRDAPGRTPAGP